MHIQPGQIYRDRYFDPKPNARLRKYSGPSGNVDLTKRTIRIVEQLDDGRYLCELVTDHSGRPVDRPRRTRISAKTMASGYELVSSTEKTS